MQWCLISLATTAFLVFCLAGCDGQPTQRIAKPEPEATTTTPTEPPPRHIAQDSSIRPGQTPSERAPQREHPTAPPPSHAEQDAVKTLTATTRELGAARAEQERAIIEQTLATATLEHHQQRLATGEVASPQQAETAQSRKENAELAVRQAGERIQAALMARKAAQEALQEAQRAARGEKGLRP